MSKVLVVPRTSRRTTVVVAPATRQQPTRRRRRNSGTNSRRGLSSATQYARLLADPFNEQPMKLGFGTLVPTVLATGYLRSSFTVNADGSFAVNFWPSLTGTLSINNGGLLSTTWNGPYDCSNKTGISNQMMMARAIAGGIRLFALFPETAASGVLFAGTSSGLSRAQFEANSIVGITAFASSELGLGTKGAMAVSLPVDPAAQNFYPSTITGLGTNIYPVSSSCYIAGQGFPAGTICWVELCLHLEGLPRQDTGAIGIDASADVSTQNGPAAQFSTFEQFAQTARRLVVQPVVMDAAEGVLNHFIPGAGPVIHSVRNAFGHGRSTRQLVSGANFSHQSRQGGMVIEEMKEERGS